MEVNVNELLIIWNNILRFQFSSVQSLSRVRLFATPRIATRQASVSITISQSSLRLTSIESVMPSSHLILCRPLLLLPPIPPSIRVFSNESTLCMRWPKYWSFSFSIIPSKEIPGLISFRMDWLDLLAVQGTLKSLLQHHSSKASILWRSALLIPHFPIRATAFLHWAKKTENGENALDNLGKKPLQLHVFVLNSIFASFLFFTLHLQSQGKKNTER